jgi:ABC-type antimicrobial peptide transport system permease subunit
MAGSTARNAFSLAALAGESFPQIWVWRNLFWLCSLTLSDLAVIGVFKKLARQTSFIYD